MEFNTLLGYLLIVLLIYCLVKHILLKKQEGFTSFSPGLSVNTTGTTSNTHASTKKKVNEGFNNVMKIFKIISKKKK